MNSYRKSVELGLTGTEAQKVAILTTLSVSNIDASKIMLWLSEKNLLSYDGSTWWGQLQDLIPTLPQPLQDGIREMKARLLMGQPIRSAEPGYAPKLFALVSGVAAALPNSTGLIDSLYALDGGRPFKDLTTAQFIADQTAYAQQLAAEEAAKQAELAAASETAKRTQAYSALIDTAQWLTAQPTRPTNQQIIARLSANLPEA